MDFRAVFHTRKERELEPCIRQTQTYPHIFFSSGLSRTKCPLGDLSILAAMLCSLSEFLPQVKRIDSHAVVCGGSLNHFQQ